MAEHLYRKKNRIIVHTPYFFVNFTSVSEVKIVLEVNTDEDEAEGEVPDVVDQVPDAVDQVPLEVLINDQEPFSVSFHEQFPAPELCACSNVTQVFNII